ncbi:hypothetical protein GmRootV116_51320 [Variovorax sp. V116]
MQFIEERCVLAYLPTQAGRIKHDNECQRKRDPKRGVINPMLEGNERSHTTHDGTVIAR